MADQEKVLLRKVAKAAYDFLNVQPDDHYSRDLGRLQKAVEDLHKFIHDHPEVLNGDSY